MKYFFHLHIALVLLLSQTSDQADEIFLKVEILELNQSEEVLRRLHEVIQRHAQSRNNP